MGFTIDVTGTDKSIAGLKAWEEKIKNEIKKQVKESTVNIESKTKQKTPVKTGTLKGSYTHEFKEENNQYIGGVGTHVPYATSVEFGTSRQSAQPHLIPSYEEELENFNEQIEDICKGR